MILLLAATCAFAAVLVALIWFAPASMRRDVLISTSLALALPLIVLWIFEISAYHRDNWWPFRYGSVTPHALAALLFLSLLIGGLVRASGPAKIKLPIGISACFLWLGLWLLGSIFLACSMGDCI